MIILINDTYRINRDEYQWIIEKRAPRSDKKRKQWQARTFHANLNQVMEKLVKLGLAHSDVSTLVGFEDVLSATLRTLQASIKDSQCMSITAVAEVQRSRVIK